MEAPNITKYNWLAQGAKEEEEWRICYETTRFSCENVCQLTNVIQSVEMDIRTLDGNPDLRAYITDMVCGPHCNQFKP